MCCLSVVSFAIIFSHSEDCLFTLLIVSFVVQNLFSLIRSHLFIFAFISNILGGFIGVIVALQCCISSVLQTESSIYVYVCVSLYICMSPLFFGFPSHLGYHRTLSIVP